MNLISYLIGNHSNSVQVLKAKSMKTILFSLGVIFNLGVFAQSWTILTSGTTNNLKSVHFPSATIGYASGFGGTILKTINGGTTWTALSTNYPTYWFWDIHFVTDNIGFIVGESDPGTNPGGAGLVLKTIDGGTTWTTCLANPGIPTRDLFVLDQNTLFVCGGAEQMNGKILKSTDSGTSWTPIGQTYFDAMLGGMVFINSTTGYLGLYESVFGTVNPGLATWLSTANGSSFTPTVIPQSASYWVFSSDFPTATTGYFIRSTYANFQVYLRKTTDGGATWTENPIDAINYPINSNDFLTATKGYIAGAAGAIKKTMDGGATWTAETSGITDDLYDIAFINDNLGFAVGDNGRIIKYSSTSNVGISDNPDQQTTVTLYPNPSNGSFQVTGLKGDNNLTVYDSRGSIVLSTTHVIDGSLIEVPKLSSGIYTISITNETGSVSNSRLSIQ